MSLKIVLAAHQFRRNRCNVFSIVDIKNIIVSVEEYLNICELNM